MSVSQGDPERDPWRFPALERFGEQFVERSPPSRPVYLTRLPAAALAVVVLAAVVTALALQGGLARAVSVVNRAPAAAKRSRSVAFSSTIQVSAAGRLLRTFSQQGEIDFAGGGYQTVLGASGSTTALISVGGTLYVQRSTHGAARSGWVAVPLTAAERKQLAAAPESDALTDPLALLRILERTRAPIHDLRAGVVTGVDAKCYLFATPLGELLRLSSGRLELPAQLRRAGGTFEVCLDADGRPLTVAETLKGAAASGGVLLTADVVFSSYGEPTAIAAPAAVRRQARPVGTPQPLFGGPTRIFERLLRTPSR